MVVCLNKSSLELIQHTNIEWKIQKTCHSNCSVYTTEHDNQAEFKRLRDEDKRIAALYAAALAVGAGTIPVGTPLVLMGGLIAGSVNASLILKRSRKIQSILENGEGINATFKDRSPQIFCDLPVPEQGRLDILVRFPLAPQKAIFAIALRSHGKSKVYYDERKEALYLRTRGGWKLWKPDHIERLALQESWLRRNRQAELFGVSSKDKNRPVIKLLVLTKETKIGQHSDSLYTQVGDQRVLLLRRRSSVYVLEEDQLLPFIKAWFTSMG